MRISDESTVCMAMSNEIWTAAKNPGVKKGKYLTFL
jgi:hypothetical protein